MASNALDGKPLGDGVAALTGAAASVGLRAVVEAGGSGVSRLLGRGVEDAEGEAATVAHDVEGDVSKGDVCGLSFAANTPVTLADGSVRAIAALKTGDTVLAYDPTTSKAGPQPVEHVFVNHDANLVDVMLVSDGAARTPATSAASDGKARDAAVAAHGMRAPPAATDTMQQATRHTETIHTTTNHPWFTADHGWLPAGFLRVGERVVRADGATATVAAVRAVPGVADMWDLTVGQVHTFAVGTDAYVVHNCGPTNDPELKDLSKQVYRRVGRDTGDWGMTVAVADVKDSAGSARRLVTFNERMVTMYGRERLETSARDVLGDGAELYTASLDRFGRLSGHAESYVAGFLKDNAGSTLDRIGVSHPDGFCPRCFSGLGRLMG